MKQVIFFFLTTHSYLILCNAINMFYRVNLFNEARSLVFPVKIQYSMTIS